MDLLLDVNIAVDVCTKRPAFYKIADHALAKCTQAGGRIWLYAGSVQTLEYVTRSEFKYKMLKAGRDLTARQLEKLTRKMLKAFAADKHWLAALSDEGDVYDSADPEDEQLVRALGRFNKGEIAFLTRDERLLDLQDRYILSPQAYLALNVSSKPIDFIDLKTQQDAIRPQLEQNIHRVLHHGRYILGPEVGQLEERLAAYTGAKHCITVASGTEALLISLMALGIKAGDEVITTPFTFVATAEVIVLVGAIPVFVDIEPDTCNINSSLIEEKITEKTKAIMPVSLYGQPPDMDEINEIASKHNLPVIEDAAQSFGAIYKGKKSCNVSTIGCTSFFPSKPLGCYGDGGAVFTNDDTIAQACREIRVHGQSKRYVHTRIGVGGRMDTVQCAVILAKLDRFDWEVERRMKFGGQYNQWMDEAGIQRVQQRDDRASVFAQYTIIVENREQIQRVLQEAGIPTAIHYPIALDEQSAYKKYNNTNANVAKQIAKQVLSLPMGPELPKNKQENIMSVLVNI